MRGRVGRGNAQKTAHPKERLKRTRELRNEPTEAEKKLWSHLRRKQLGGRFRRQHPAGPFILDFFCHEAGLAVEVDGGGHAGEERAGYDAERTRALAAERIRVIRFWNSEVTNNIEGVLETIHNALEERKKEQHTPPPPSPPLRPSPGGGGGKQRAEVFLPPRGRVGEGE